MTRYLTSACTWAGYLGLNARVRGEELGRPIK